MSIDSFIRELDKSDRDLEKLKNLSENLLEDYVTASEAYLELMILSRNNFAKVTLIAEIVEKMMDGIKGLVNLVQGLGTKGYEESLVDHDAGRLIKAEQSINLLIGKLALLEEDKNQ